MVGTKKSYTIEYKIKTVEESRNHCLTEFCKIKKLDLRMVRRWRSEYENLVRLKNDGNLKVRRVGAGRKPLYGELEDAIFEWIINQRAEAFVVRRLEIQNLAMELAPIFDISLVKFKASNHWVDGFLTRYELSLRRSTTLFKLEDGEVVKRALLFKAFIDNLNFAEYKLSNIIAMDETSVFFGSPNQTTIDRKGISSINIPSTGYESTRITCILAIDCNGKKLPPMLITKGKKDVINCISGVYDTRGGQYNCVIIMVYLKNPKFTRE